MKFLKKINMVKNRKISTYFYDFFILSFLVFVKKKLHKVLEKKSFYIMTVKKKPFFSMRKST
jgi:hypothetical protein